jgi:hypothetical protein
LVASKHPRLGVARDPVLEEALARTRALLDPSETRSAAAHVRALALRGAERVVGEHDDPVVRYRHELREKYKLRPAAADPLSYRMPEGDIDPEDPSPASDALRWVRGEGKDP